MRYQNKTALTTNAEQPLTCFSRSNKDWKTLMPKLRQCHAPLDFAGGSMDLQQVVTMHKSRKRLYQACIGEIVFFEPTNGHLGPMHQDGCAKYQ